MATDLPAVPVHAAANLRLSVILAVPLAIIGVTLLSLIGHPWAGVFAAAGLALGALNTYFVQRSVVRYAGSLAQNRKKRFVGSVLFRLGVLTLAALVAMVLVRPDGLGVAAGLAAFQVLMMLSATSPLFKELRKA